MATAGRIARWTAGVLLVLMLVVAGLAFLLLRSQPGHDFFLRTVLRQLPDYVNGTVEVGALRSGGLLRGFTLHQIAIRDSAGRPFLEADSIEVRYSIRDLVARNIVLVPARVWAPEVTIETLPGDSLSNVVRIFARPDPDDPDSATDREGPSISLAFRDVELYDGTLTLRVPLAEGDGIPGGVTEPAHEAGGRVQVIRLANLQAEVAEASILSRGQAGERFTVESLSFDGYVLEAPFHVEAFRGEVLREGTRVSIEANRIWFPGTELSGPVVVDWSNSEGGVSIETALQGDVISLADFHWLEPRLPDGEGSLGLTYSGTVGRGSLRVQDVDLRFGRSHVRGRFGIDFGDALRFAETDLELIPFDLALLEPWLPEPLPVEGLARGTISARGGLAALDLVGELSLEEAGPDLPPMFAQFEGTLHSSGGLGVSDFQLSVDPFPFPVLASFAPDVAWAGEGRVNLVASGRLDEGLSVDATLEHAVPAGFPSQLQITGTITQEGQETLLAIDAILEPLSLDGVAAGLGLEFPVSGEVRGPVRLTGPLGDLAVVGRLSTPAGVIDAGARFDARDPLRGYEVEGSIEDFHFDELIAGVPERTDLTGDFRLVGQGGTLETLAGSLEMTVRDSRIAGLDLERLETQLRAEEGRLIVELLELSSPLLALSGSGDFPLREDQEDGEILVQWDAASLDALRPVLFGEEPIAADTLTALERQILVAEGVDPDTLQVTDRIVLDGRVSGRARLAGRLTDMRGEADLQIEEGAYGANTLGLASASVTGHWSREGARELEGTADFEGLVIESVAFATGRADVAYRQGVGEFALDLESGADETYAAAGSFTADSTAVEVVLETLLLDFRDAQWNLAAPSRMRIADSSVRIDDLRIVRPAFPGGEGVMILANGLLDLQGDSDLQVRMTGVDLARMGRIVQTEWLPAGILTLDLDVRGPYDAPRMVGEFRIEDFSVDGTALSSLEGSIDYEGRRLTAHLVGELDGRELLTAEGQVPIDLSFRSIEDRFPDETLDGTIVVSALPAATALAFLTVLEEVQGTIDGEIQLRGTPRDFSPSGEVRLRGGSVLLAELGIRPSGIDADFRLREDGTLDLEGTVRSQGTARVSGVVSLSDLTNPGFEDLVVQANGFQAVNRRDLAARVGGNVVLGGSYAAPRITGQVRIEGGELFLDEVVRSADVVDLSDPSYLDVVDTTLVAGQPAFEGAQNAFLQNLRVEVDLALDRDFWLRSSEMDVEIAGDLIVTFDRRQREILLIGTLEPIRGTYSRFSRQFQVQGGTVEFVGIPGINPTLDIAAVTRLRTEGGEPLNITANVRGNLISPRVTLSSDSQPPIAESDLISYLLFGRPSFALASAETSALNSAIGSQVVSQVAGALAFRLGAELGRGIGLDYFSITQARDPSGLGSAAGLSGTFAHTQIELGQYLTSNIFLAVVLRPLGGLQTGNQAQIPGARLEWRFTDAWSMEGFVEDRFAREGTSGFGELGLRLSKVFGLSIFREWGY